MELYELAVRRAGAPSLAELQRREGLPPTGRLDAASWAVLLPWLKGYRSYRVAPGDNYSRIAARFGTTVRALITANPNQDPLRLYVDQLLTVPLGFEVVPADMPLTYELLTLCLDGLAARYPFLTVRNIGQSAYGRKLPQVAVGLGPRRVLYNASHHANEWITTPLLLRFAEELAAAAGAGGEISGISAGELLDYAALCLVPAVNPDGMDLVTGELSAGEAYRSARAIAERYPRFPFPSGWKANIRGVDLNLQYPAGWEEARLYKYGQGITSPAPADFVGEAPLTAPEARALAELTERFEPALTLSYHSQGEVIFWNWRDYAPENAASIGRLFAELSGYRLLAEPAAPSSAGYKDWFLQEFRRPGYTVELGRGVNPLPIGDFPAIYARNLPLLTIAALVT